MESVTTLKRYTTEPIADVKREREPVLITQRGLPAAYLIDIETYELHQRRMQILEGIIRGEKAIADGKVWTHEEVKKKLSKWLE